MTFSPGSSFPDSIRHIEFGAPRSTSATLLFRSALKSAHSAELPPWTQIAGLTLQPNDVDTHLVFNSKA